jgi:hypothetical protein
MNDDTSEPERFTVRYPSGTVLESVWLTEGGGTLRAVALEHPLAAVEADEGSRIEAAP